jgi:hypothetical protein
MAQATTATGAPVINYGARGGRKTFFCFVFLLLLPFWISLPAMMVQRITKGLWFDTVGLAVLGLFFTFLMALVVFELMLSLRAKVTVGQTGVRVVLPSRGGLLPMLGYRRNEVSYADIASVEMRREVYGGAWAPVLLRGARIKTKDGKAIQLGYVSEADRDPTFPVPEIAAEISKRAGVDLVDTGTVQRQVRKKVLGIAASAEENKPLSEPEIAGLNQAHGRLMSGLVVALAVLLLGGVISDVMTSSIDRGERAMDAVQRKK